MYFRWKGMLIHPLLMAMAVLPGKKELGNFDPLVAVLLLGVKQDLFFLCTPGAVVDGWTQHLVPSVPALFGCLCATQTASALFLSNCSLELLARRCLFLPSLLPPSLFSLTPHSFSPSRPVTSARAFPPRRSDPLMPLTLQL